MTRIPEQIEIKCINPDGSIFQQKYIRKEKYDDLSRKFDKVVSQRNLLARKPGLLNGLEVSEVLKELDNELEIKSE